MIGGQVSYRPLSCNSHGVQMYRISIYNKIRCTDGVATVNGKTGDVLNVTPVMFAAALARDARR